MRTLNDNVREMATFNDRFATLDSEIERLLNELEATLRAKQSTEQQIEQRVAEVAATRAELERAREFADEALYESAEAARERDEAVEAARAAQAEQARSVTEAGDLSARLCEREDQCSALRAELAARDQRLDLSDAEYSLTAGELERVRGELERARIDATRFESLEASLALAHADVAERVRRWIELDAENTQLRARVIALEPLVERLQTAEAALETLREESARTEAELDGAWTQRHAAAMAAVQREVESLAQRLSAACDVQAATEQRLLHAGEERNQLAARLQVRDGELAVSRRERDDGARELALVQKQAKGLAHDLEQLQNARRKLSERVEVLERELADARRAHTEDRTQLAALGASHRAKQLELDRRAVRLERLEKARDERDERIRTLLADARTHEVERRAREAEVKRLASRKNGVQAQHDDLKSIAGIGPALEKKLRRVGITTFRQLAALTREELEHTADKLGLSAERIRREGWIAAARDEARTQRSSPARA